MHDFLTKIDLPEYIPLFEKNGITEDTLKDLTNDDLKDIGIEVLGHRKKILSAIQDVEKEKSSIEKVFYNNQVNIVNGGVATVKITSHRAILGEKTYSLQNIAAVEAFSNKAEVESRYEAAMLAWKAQVAASNGPKMGGILMIAFGILMFIVGAKDQEGGGFMCGVICIVIGLAAMANKAGPPEPIRENPVWSVRIQASGTSSDVVQSYNEQTIREVVKALNEAIMNLNV